MTDLDFPSFWRYLLGLLSADTRLYRSLLKLPKQRKRPHESEEG